MADLAEEMKRANDLKERELDAAESIARSQAVVAGCVEQKSREGTAWQKFWYGGNGGAGHRSAHMRVRY